MRETTVGLAGKFSCGALLRRWAWAMLKRNFRSYWDRWGIYGMDSTRF